jgi:ATP synthase subunit 6
MNIHTLHDNFQWICATPLEQFQILPLSMQSYTGLTGTSSLEQASLFPVISQSDEFLYLVGGASSFDQVTSWSHHQWVDLYSTVPAYLSTAASFDDAGFITSSSQSIKWYQFGSWILLPLVYAFLTLSKAALAGYFFAMTNLSFAVTALSQVFMIFQGLSQGFACSPLAGFVATDLSSFSAGIAQFVGQFNDFVYGLFAGQLILGPIFTNFMLISILGFIMVNLFMSFALYKINLVPNRWQSFVELIYGFILNTICEQVGSQKGEKYFPALATLFFTILSANVIALFPYTYSITAQMIVTFTISFFAFGVVNVIGFLHHGVYLSRMLLPGGCPVPIVPLIILIELVSYVSRVISLSLRIFANILSGHCMLKILTIGIWFLLGMGGLSLIGYGVALAIVIVINILEVMVAAIQAWVFLILICLYTNDVLEGGH